MYEIAYYWRLAPDLIMSYPLSKILKHESQAERLAKLADPDG